MTPADFITEAVSSFELGKIIVVSGPNYETVWNLLTQTGTALENAGKPTLIYNSRQTTLYEHRRESWVENQTEAILFEYIALITDGAFVVLVANQFDREDKNQNPKKRNISIDTFLDIFKSYNVSSIPETASRVVQARELFNFMSKLYYYDTRLNEITFIKDQIAVRPP